MDTSKLVNDLRKLIAQKTEELNKLKNALAMLVPTNNAVIQPVKRGRGRPRKAGN
jgi:hypothetical protein